jgi:hypothetical protein
LRCGGGGGADRFRPTTAFRVGRNRCTIRFNAVSMRRRFVPGVVRIAT